MKCTTHSLPHCQNRQFTLFYYELHVKCLPSCLMANHCLLWHRSKCFRIACGVESPCLWIPKILFVYPSILSVFIMYYMPNPFPECLCSHHTLSCCFKTYCLPILSCTIIIVNEELSYFPLFTIWSVQSTCGITWVKVSVKKFNFYNQSHYGILVFYQTPECLITVIMALDVNIENLGLCHTSMGPSSSVKRSRKSKPKWKRFFLKRWSDC